MTTRFEIGAIFSTEMDTLDTTVLAESVLSWLETMKISPTEYKMNEMSDGTIFTSCFALFILDLFRQTDAFAHEHKEQWISHIQSYQDKKDGYFKPKERLHKDQEPPD